MRSLTGTILAVVLAAAGASVRAAEPPSSTPKAYGLLSTDKSRQEFSSWFIHRAKQFQLPPSLVHAVIFIEPEKAALRFQLIAREIAERDSLLSAYLDQLAANQKAYGRLNPFDVEVLSVLKASLLNQKRELLDRFSKLTGEWGVKPEDNVAGTAMKEALPGKPKEGDRRYNPESGAWETYRESSKSWEAPVDGPSR